MRLNKLLSVHKRKQKLNAEDTSTETNSFIWATSNLMLMFLENVIK
jgi:hypothetical protein